MYSIQQQMLVQECSISYSIWTKFLKLLKIVDLQ
jgi:hypothetical protein